MSDNEARARELAFELPLSVGPHPPKWVTDRLAAALSAAELRGRAEGLREGLTEARNILPIAYREGFGQGMREHTSHKGGNSFEESICAKRQAVIDSRLAALSREETKAP